jgi:hypothetical protein
MSSASAREWYIAFLQEGSMGLMDFNFFKWGVLDSNQ